MKATKKTKAFSDARTYLRKSAFAALFLSMVSLPLLVTVPEIELTALRNFGFWIFSIYASVSAYMFGRLFRCIRVLAILEK